MERVNGQVMDRHTAVAEVRIEAVPGTAGFEGEDLRIGEPDSRLVEEGQSRNLVVHFDILLGERSWAEKGTGYSADGLDHRNSFGLTC
jgi:hypothetical protein